MPDRRKLAAPLFAQAAAFVAVLVIGGFAGHTSTTPGPSTAAGRENGLKLTVKVVEEGTGGLSVSGSQVAVLQTGTLTGVASGPLNPALEFAANVPAGPYQVCINPPTGWASTVRTTHALAGWICTATDVRTGPQLVTFRLTSQLQVGR